MRKLDNILRSDYKGLFPSIDEMIINLRINGKSFMPIMDEYFNYCDYNATYIKYITNINDKIGKEK